MSEANVERLERIIEEANSLDDKDKVVIEAFAAGYKSGLLNNYLKEDQKAAV